MPQGDAETFSLQASFVPLVTSVFLNEQDEARSLVEHFGKQEIRGLQVPSLSKTTLPLRVA